VDHQCIGTQQRRIDLDANKLELSICTSAHWNSALAHQVAVKKSLPLLIGPAAKLQCNNSGCMIIFKSLRRCRQLFIMSVSMISMLSSVMIKILLDFYKFVELNLVRNILQVLVFTAGCCRTALASLALSYFLFGT